MAALLLSNTTVEISRGWPIHTYCSTNTPLGGGSGPPSHPPEAAPAAATPSATFFLFFMREKKSCAPGLLLLAGWGWLIHKAIFRNRPAEMKPVIELWKLSQCPWLKILPAHRRINVEIFLGGGRCAHCVRLHKWQQEGEVLQLPSRSSDWCRRGQKKPWNSTECRLWDSVSCREGSLFLELDESEQKIPHCFKIWFLENLHQEQIALTSTPPDRHLNVSAPN